MARLTITEAAIRAGIARQTLYAGYINKGKVTVSTDERGNKFIDTSEILRVFGELKPDNDDTVTLQDFRRNPTPETDALQREIEHLRERLTELQARETAAAEREKWLQGQIETLTGSLKLVEHRQESNRGFFARIFGR